jgi:CHAD domain-containing protein
MRGDEAMAEALQDALQPHADKLKKFLRKAEKGDANAIHHARTTLRRLREGLVVMGRTVFEPATTRELEGAMHRVEQLLGPTRDDDVLLADVDDWLAHGGRASRQALQRPRDHMANVRQRHMRKLKRHLGRSRTRKALKRLRRFVAGGNGAAQTPPKNPAKAAPSLVRHFVPDETWRAYDAVLAYETRLPADFDVIHKVRSSARRLRYLLELFDGALPPGAQDVVDSLRALQDRLGELHDHVVALERLERWIQDGSLKDDPALRKYLDHRRQARDELAAEFDDEWRKLTGKVFRFALSRIISGEIGKAMPDGAVRLTA